MSNKGDLILVGSRRYRIHEVYYDRDCISAYRWNDVIAKTITRCEVARFRGSAT